MPRRTTAARQIRVLVPAAVLGALVAGGLPAVAGPAAAAGGPRAVSLFPTDAATVPDGRQLTGRRLALPTAGCTTVTTCGLVERLNELDGFDLDPRLALRFDADVDVADVVASTTVARAGARSGMGIDRVVYDAATRTVYAHPVRQLDPGTRYEIRVSAAHGLAKASTRFTTLSATDGLLDLRRQLDSGRAYADVGIGADQRGLTVDAAVDATGTSFAYVSDQGPAGGLVTTPAPSAVGAGTVVFGSYLAPSWLRKDRTIEQVGTDAAGPRALGKQRLPFVLVLPPGPAPLGGWPTAVFGHGFTRSDGDVLLAAATNAASGMATIATTVAGHGFGPASTWTFTRGGETTTVPAYGRGVDLDGDGVIASTEGSGTLPTGPAAAVGSRDGLRQTSADVMTLVRAVAKGLDVGGTPGTEVRRNEVTYFGQSFGGIYGTMVAGADYRVSRAVLNVAGGPITEIARLSPAFRLLTTQALQNADLLNSTSEDKAFFEESMPLRGQPPVLAPAPGALAIQDYLSRSTWLTRPGSPETFAPRVRDQRALFQVAFGDQTVPNPTSHTLLTAGTVVGRSSIFRNDKLPSADTNPHGFLLNPVEFPTGFAQGQAQVRAFLGDGSVVDPDGPLGIWEVPAEEPSLLRSLNYTSPAFPNG